MKTWQFVLMWVGLFLAFPWIMFGFFRYMTLIADLVMK